MPPGEKPSAKFRAFVEEHARDRLAMTLPAGGNETGVTLHAARLTQPGEGQSALPSELTAGGTFPGEAHPVPSEVLTALDLGHRLFDLASTMIATPAPRVGSEGPQPTFVLVCIGLFVKAMKTFRSVQVLVERGLGEDANGLMRPLSDVLASLLYLRGDRERRAQEYLDYVDRAGMKVALRFVDDERLGLDLRCESCGQGYGKIGRAGALERCPEMGTRWRPSVAEEGALLGPRSRPAPGNRQHDQQRAHRPGCHPEEVLKGLASWSSPPFLVDDLL
jgi:hypothetical protein